MLLCVSLTYGWTWGGVALGIPYIFEPNNIPGAYTGILNIFNILYVYNFMNNSNQEMENIEYNNLETIYIK